MKEKGKGRSIAEAIQGERLEPVEFLATKEMVEMYAVAVDDRHPWYTESSPFNGRIAHPTLATTLGYRWREQHFPALGGERGYPMQTKVEFEFYRPMKIGEKVIISGVCSDRYIKRGREYVVFTHDVTDETGQHVLRYTTEMVLPGKVE